MVIEDGKFYFIKDEFFDIFKDYGLMVNIFPTTEKYIEKKYTNSNIDVEIPTTERDNVIITSLRVVRLAERGINIPFYNIIEMRDILLKEQN